MTGLTYANQVGAPGGLNQAAPGTFIPEDFVRWSQDVLFDRAGLLRRRKPFETFALYDNAGSSVSQPSVADERVLGVISTLNFDGDAVFGIVVTNDRISAAYTKIYFYDKDFKYQSFSTLDAFSSNAILSAKPDINNSAGVGTYTEHSVNTVLSFLDVSNDIVMVPERADVIEKNYRVANDTSTPNKYYFVGDDMFVYPAINGSPTMRLYFLQLPVAATATSGTSAWLIPSRHHSIVLYGALVKAFLVNDDPQATMFQNMFEARYQQMRNDLWIQQYDRTDRVHVVSDAYDWNY